MPKKKTFLIGIDGASWNYIDFLLKKGKLLSIDSLIKNGIKGILKSTIPPFSPVAWSSFMTGTLPHKHGIYDWCRINIKNNKLRIRNVRASDRKKISFWHYLNNEGYTVGVYNLPLTFPAEKVKGFFISGFDSPDLSKLKYYPDSLYEEITNEYDNNFLKLPNFANLSNYDNHVNFVRQYSDYCSVQTEIFIKYVKKYNIDVGIINFMINDHFNHRIKDDELFLKGLEICDTNIGKIIEEFPTANYIIFSDHGSLRTKNALLIYNWLYRNNLTKFDHKNLNINKINTLVSHKFRNSFLQNNQFLEKLLRKSIVSLISLIPNSYLDKLISKISNLSPAIDFWPHNSIDIKRSKIIFSSAGSNGLYINPIYKSDKTTYKKILEEVVSNILELEDPATGEKVFSNLYLNLYNQNNNTNLQCPDIITELNTTVNIWIKDNINSKIGEKLFVSNNKINYYGRHIRDGIFIFSGPFVDNFRSLNINNLSLTDIPAIVLSLYNVPIPPDFDISIDLLKSINKKNNNFNSTENINEPEDTSLDLSAEKEIEKKLSDLGYM